jgi:hypothetical protein
MGDPGGVNAGIAVYFAISVRAWETIFCGTVVAPPTVDFDAFAAVDAELDAVFELPQAETDSDTTKRLNTNANDLFFAVFISFPPC